MDFLNKLTKINAAFFVFILAFLYRIPNITNFVNNDDSLWKYRGYVFGESLLTLDFARTAVTYHPGVPLMWSQALAIKVFGLLDSIYFKGHLMGRELFYYNHLIQNIFLIFFSSIIITAVFIFIRRVWNEENAILFILILLLEPFFIALARSIHLDVLVTLFIYLGFLAFYNYCIKSYKYNGFFSTAKLKTIIFGGLFCALAVLTKSVALFILPLLLSVLAFFLIIDKKNFKKYLVGFMWVVVYTLIFFVLIWPAMWVSPLHTLWIYFYQGIFDTAIEEGHKHLWFGVETMDPGFWYYPISLVGRYTLLPVFGTILGTGVVFYRIIKEKLHLNRLDDNTKFALLNLVFFVGFFTMLTLTSKKLDRYTLTILLPMIVLTVYSVGFLRARFGKIILTLVTAILLVRVFLLIWIHPNYLVYYSPLIGGFDYGRVVIDPKWPVGFDLLSEYLNEENQKNGSKIMVVSADIPDAVLLGYFADFESTYPDSKEAKRGQYFIVPVWRDEESRIMKKKFNLQPEMIVKTIKVAGVDYYDIYKKSQPTTR